MRMIVTRVDEIEAALMRALERESCTADQGCSALANVLLSALVKCKKDPRVSAQVADEMRRLAAKINGLAAADDDAVDRVLADMKTH